MTVRHKSRCTKCLNMLQSFLYKRMKRQRRKHYLPEEINYQIIARRFHDLSFTSFDICNAIISLINFMVSISSVMRTKQQLWF